MLIVRLAIGKKGGRQLRPALHHIDRRMSCHIYIKKCNSRNAKFIPDPHGDNAGVAHKPHLTHTAKTSTKSNHQSPIILAGELHSAPYMYARIWVTQ